MTFENETVQNNLTGTHLEQEIEEEMQNNPEPLSETSIEITEPTFISEEGEDSSRRNVEPIFNVNTFKDNSPHGHQAIQALTPPPKFKDIVQTCPQNLAAAFSEQLHGKLVGVWPIRKHFLIRSSAHKRAGESS